MASTSPSPPPAGPRPLPSRILTKLVAVLLGFSSFLCLALWALGLVGSASLLHLGAAAILGILACLLWELVERAGRPGSTAGGTRSVLAWIAFPLALLLFFAQVPLLVLAIYPPIRGFYEQVGRVEAQVVSTPDGERLLVWFPRPMVRRGNNLRLGGEILPASYFAEDRGIVSWPDKRTLSVNLDRLESALGRDLGAIETILLNSDLHRLATDPSTVPFTAADGDPLPHQRITLAPR